MTLRERVDTTLRGYRTINRLVPNFVSVIVLRAIADALIPAVGVYMPARVVAALAAGRDLRAVLTLALITVFVNLLLGLISKTLTRLENYYTAKFYRVYEEPLNEKVREMDYERIEDADIHSMLESIKLRGSANGLGLPKFTWCTNRIVQGLFKVIFSTAMVLGAFTARSTSDAGFWSFVFKPWFALVIIGIIAINILLEMLRASFNAKMANIAFSRFRQTVREGRYYSDALAHNYSAGKDMKLYALRKPIRGELMRLYTELYENVLGRLNLLEAKHSGYAALLNTFMTGTVYAYVAVKALYGGFGAGETVQYAGALGLFGGGMSMLLSEASMLLANADALRNYFEFTDIPDMKYQGGLTTEKRVDNEYEIEFRNVSFKYPKSRAEGGEAGAYALKNLSLKFNIGQRMAVVGMNGSGKTTMIKLLCRLYDPTEGEITLNGIDIKKYDYAEYLQLFSVVFQDFKLFSFSLGQNVAASAEIDRDKARQCLNMAGFANRSADIPLGLDTPLYKDFDEGGVEISGGEAQKIALARALYKNAPFIVLDEPTAALDPVAEFEIYSKFNEIVGNKTAVYISHRLSSCRFCDDIAVFHGGELVQRGNHDALIADEGGKYYELWNAQAQYYTEETAG